MSRLIVLLIGAYRYALSPLLGPACRFYPSCSHYAQEAITRYGAGKGLWLAGRRILRCNPWHCGGHDPVP
jgi:putative membrane protein insertion efficiency factor